MNDGILDLGGDGAEVINMKDTYEDGDDLCDGGMVREVLSMEETDEVMNMVMSQLMMGEVEMMDMV